MNILTIGDVVGDSGTQAVTERLPELIRQYEADFCVVNGENACSANGITRRKAELLLSAGADVVTLGNHTFRQKEAVHLLANQPRVIRPMNFPPKTPGHGSFVTEVRGRRVAVMNALGRVYMDSADCPFRAVEETLRQLSPDIAILDFHAEATSEKTAMGWFLDGRVSVVFGTHTHVQTADARVLPRGTGYITDLGMCGPYYSCLGVERQIVINRFVTQMPERFVFADGAAQISGAVFSVSEETGKCTRAESFLLYPEGVC